ncbi:MAG: YfhO family protein [Lachnospiraceae bacterium]
MWKRRSDWITGPIFTAAWQCSCSSSCIWPAEDSCEGKGGVLYAAAVFFASFSINVLNFIWHGFHYPNSLPCRQSFIYIFLMLLICYRAYMYLDRHPGNMWPWRLPELYSLCCWRRSW